MDAATREQVRLRAKDHREYWLPQAFDPRNDEWSEHFSFHGPRIVGRTAVGRATVRVLGMNDRERVELRLHLLESPT